MCEYQHIIINLNGGVAGKWNTAFMSLGKYYDSIDEILHSMSEYLGISEEDDYGFDEDMDDDDFIDEPCCTRADVCACGNILENYIDNLITVSKSPTDEAILKFVEKTVKKLNKLNEKCEYELIEATQSDDICDLIHNAAVEAGLCDIPDNVADEWRDF